MAKQEWTRELQAKIIARAWKDENFRKQLVSNPKAALKEFGVDLPEGIDFKVVCNDSSHVHFVLPQSPTNVSGLTESELGKLAAGGFKVTPWDCGWTLVPPHVTPRQ